MSSPQLLAVSTPPKLPSFRNGRIGMNIPCETRRAVVAIFSYNNGPELEKTLNGIPSDFPYAVLVHVDGSDDGSDQCLSRFKNVAVIRTEKNMGIGVAVMNVVRYAKENDYFAISFVPGNNKCNMLEASRLIEPVLLGQAEYVQGSRYLEGSLRDHTPLFRLVVVKLHALFFRLVSGRPCTDVIGGFRAFKTEVFYDPKINIWQSWLSGYEMETYFLFHLLRSAYRIQEVPVSWVYPANRRTLSNLKGVTYSHIRPVIDWWNIAKPLFYMAFGLRR